MPAPNYSAIKKAKDIPPLPEVVAEMLKDYNLPEGSTGSGDNRGSGRL